MGSKSWLVTIVVILLLVGAGVFILGKNTPTTTTSPTPTPIVQTSASPEATTAASEQTMEKLIIISSSSFTPPTLTIKVGETVTWKNTTSAPHIINSDPHPTHTLYPILNQVGRIESNKEKSLTFTEAGTFKYHDHLNPSLMGTIIVE